MRICVVGPTYPYRGGIAHYTTLLVRHLRAAGHWAKLYSFTRQYPRFLFPGKTDRDPSATPLRVDCEYVLDPINPLTWWRLYRKIKRDAPDLLILQWWVPYWTPCLTVLSRLVRNNTRTKILYVCHNVVPHDGGGTLDRRLAMAVLRRGDAFIVHSEQDLWRLRALLPKAQITHTHHPTYQSLADTARPPQADVRRELGLEAERVVLFFGFVRQYKGLDYLVRAMGPVNTRLPVHLLVVGEFWTSEDYFVALAEQFGVQEHITFVNRYVPNEELGRYFELADAVVLPYISATQSGVAQLAFGFGKPVITTRVGGLPEVVRDNETGLIVPPQDWQALADAIIGFYERDLGPTLSANVRRAHQQNDFSWEELVREIEASYAALHPNLPLPPAQA
jgi:glycosyltransferase involved in cell wall biosynthesis